MERERRQPGRRRLLLEEPGQAPERIVAKLPHARIPHTNSPRPQPRRKPPGRLDKTETTTNEAKRRAGRTTGTSTRMLRSSIAASTKSTHRNGPGHGRTHTPLSTVHPTDEQRK